MFTKTEAPDFGELSFIEKTKKGEPVVFEILESEKAAKERRAEIRYTMREVHDLEQIGYALSKGFDEQEDEEAKIYRENQAKTLTCLQSGQIEFEEKASSGKFGAMIGKSKNAGTVKRVYVKNQLSEPAVYLDNVTNTLCEISKNLVKEQGEFRIEWMIEQKTPMTDEEYGEQENAAYWFKMRRQASYWEAVSKYYGVPIDHVKQKGLESGIRDLRMGQTTVREFAASLFADFFYGEEVVPVTTLRTDGEQLYSVQNAILSGRQLPEQRDVFHKLLRDLKEQKTTELTESIAKVGAFHSVIGATDGHGGNIIINEKGKAEAIDNGNSFPLHKPFSDRTIGTNDLLSEALQLMTINPVIRLPEKTLNRFRAIYDKILDEVYGDGEKPVTQFLYRLLALVHRDERHPESTRHIALKELQRALAEIKWIIDHGRPRLPGIELTNEEFEGIASLEKDIQRMLQERTVSIENENRETPVVPSPQAPSSGRWKEDPLFKNNKHMFDD